MDPKHLLNPSRPATCRPGERPPECDVDHDPTLRLPHERDESTDPDDVGVAARQGPRQVIEQAASDISRGLRDTERRGIPSDVPAPRHKRSGPRDPVASGACVPPEGVSRYNYAEAQKPRPDKDGHKRR